MQVPDELQAAAVPLLFICAASDNMFPKKTRTAVQQMLDRQTPGKPGFV
jgi:dienelactone hydrolase